MKILFKYLTVTVLALTLMCSCDQNNSSTSEAEIEAIEKISSTQSDVELKAFDDGWREGYLTAVEEQQSKDIVVSGEFTLSVHDIIPFYGNLPDEKLLVVSFFQDYPFLLRVEKSLLDEIEVSQVYVFSVKDCILYDVPSDYFTDDNVSPDILSKPHIIASECRPAEEHELGMESICELTYELYEEE